MSRIYIGIDPGEFGAVAFVQGREARIKDCPKTLEERAELLRPFRGLDVLVAIENVNPFHKSSAKSAFTFGGNSFAWRMAATCFRLPRMLVAPKEWQKVMFDSNKKGKTTKELSFENAIRLELVPLSELVTPTGKILDGRCDALLIAAWARRADAQALAPQLKNKKNA